MNGAGHVVLFLMGLGVLGLAVWALGRLVLLAVQMRRDEAARVERRDAAVFAEYVRRAREGVPR